MTNTGGIDWVKKLNDLNNDLAKLLKSEETAQQKLAEERYNITTAHYEHERKLSDDLKRAKEENLRALATFGLSLDENEHKKKLEAIKAEIAAAKENPNTSKKQKKELAAKKKFIEEEFKIRDKLEHNARVKYNQEKIADIKTQVKESGLTGKKYAEALASALSAAGLTPADVKEAISAQNKQGIQNGIAKLESSIESTLNNNIETIASMQSEVDTRLQGSKNKTTNGSYWAALNSQITSTVGVSPFVKQEAVFTKLKDMVSSGISYNVEQRAFLATISDKIANTFNATDGTLLRLIRLQQQDSTAARLGMESAMTTFLNNMYETTEYMGSIADGIRNQIEEATALMSADESIGFEYQVQKWIGSMYSIGMSQNATTSIASALGKLAAGDVSGLTSDSTGNLIIMAANNAGISISDALRDGLDESATNKLMEAIVSYLSDIYEESKGSKVLQQQFANIYGLTASDLKAITNLNGSTSTIASSRLNYNSAMSQLMSMANTMGQRTSMSEMLNNVWDNALYGLSASMADSPVLYALWKSASALKDLTGGIDFSIPMYLGTGTTQTFNVADLMKVGALSGSALSLMSKVISGVAGGSAGGFNGSGMLKSLGIDNGLTMVSRGSGQSSLSTGGVSTSESGTLASGSGEDITSSMQTSAKNDAASAIEDNDTGSTNLNTVNDNLVAMSDVVKNIEQLLNAVSNGTALKVSPEGSSSTWSEVMSPQRY